MVAQHLANYQFQWVKDKVTYTTCLQKLPRSARTVILVDNKQQFPVAHQLKQLGITVFPHPPLAYDQYIFTHALSCFQQGTYQVLVTTPATDCQKLFKGIATHVIVDCSMSINQFWEYLTVMGPESGTVTTCISHAPDGKANMDIYDAVRHQQPQSMPQTSSLGPLGKSLLGANPWLQLGKLVCLAGHLQVMIGVHHHPCAWFLILHRYAMTIHSWA